jgi:two-component system, chemotaxis family, CheB/CheR fusion protein
VTFAGKLYNQEKMLCMSGRPYVLHTIQTPIRAPDGSIPAICGIVRDVTERRRAEEALRAAHGELERKVKERTEQLRALAEKLTRAEQAERRRIVRILHEDLQQLLAGAKYTLGSIRGGRSKAGRQAALEEVGGILEKAIQLSRSLSLGLRPPVLYESGLGAALEWLAGEMKEEFGLVVRLQGGGVAGPASEEKRDFLFHAVRELLFNVAKHAGTGTAQVRMARTGGGRLRIEVRDRGAGFDPDATRARQDTLGLFSIRERVESLGGQMQVASAPGHGTTVTLTVPLR